MVERLLLSLWAATSSTSTIAPIVKPPFGLSREPFTVEADKLVREDGIYVADGKAVLRRAGSVVFAHRITLVWTSPCKCWSAEVIVTTARDRDHLPSVQLGLDLSRLGGGF